MAEIDLTLRYSEWNGSLWGVLRPVTDEERANRQSLLDNMFVEEGLDYDRWDLAGFNWEEGVASSPSTIRELLHHASAFHSSADASRHPEIFESTALLHDFPVASFFVPDHVFLGIVLWGFGNGSPSETIEESLKGVRARIASNGLEEAYVLDARYLIELADKHLEGGVEGMTPFHKEFIRLYLGSEAPACCRA